MESSASSPPRRRELPNPGSHRELPIPGGSSRELPKVSPPSRPARPGNAVEKREKPVPPPLSSKPQRPLSSEGNDEKERNQVITELLETERAYVSDLQIIISVYLQASSEYSSFQKFIEPLRKKKIISEIEVAKLFSNTEIIVSINKELLVKLENRIQSHPILIGDLFLEPKDGILSSAYIGYCNDQTEALKCLNACKKKSSFNSFLKVPPKYPTFLIE